MSLARAARSYLFFFQAEDGIRYLIVTGVQTCALPISVGNGVRSGLARDLDLALGDERARDGGAEQILTFVDRVRAEHGKHEVARELLAQVVHENLLHAELLRLFPRRLELLALSDVGGEGDDLAAVCVLQPFEDDRGIEPARVGEDDLPDLTFHFFPFLSLPFFTFPSRRNSISAFCVCNLFSASSQTTLCGPSITSAATSSPRCAGRQCMNSASFFASRIMSASTCQFSKSRPRSSFSDSKPMLVHTSVVTRSAPRAASIGSAKLS